MDLTVRIWNVPIPQSTPELFQAEQILLDVADRTMPSKELTLRKTCGFCCDDRWHT